MAERYDLDAMRTQLVAHADASLATGALAATDDEELAYYKIRHLLTLARIEFTVALADVFNHGYPDDVFAYCVGENAGMLAKSAFDTVAAAQDAELAALTASAFADAMNGKMGTAKTLAPEQVGTA